MHRTSLPHSTDDQHGYNAVIRGHYLPQTIDSPTTDSSRAVATVKSSSQTLITVPTDVPNTDTSLMFVMLFNEPGSILRSFLRGPAAEWYYYLAYKGSNDPVTTDLFQTSQLNAASYAVSAQTTSLLSNYSSGQIYGAQLTQVPTTLQTFSPTSMELWKRNPSTSIITSSLEDGLIAFAPLPSKEQYLSRYATANGTTLGQVKTMVTVKSQQYSTFNTVSNPTYFGYNIVPVPTGAPPYAVVAYIPSAELVQFTRLLGIYRARIKIIFRTTVAPTQVSIGVSQNTVNFATNPPSLQKFNYLNLPNPFFDSVGGLAILDEVITVDIVNNMNGIYIQGIFNVATIVQSASIELASLNSVTDEISQPCSVFMMINPSAQTQFLVQGIQSYSYVPAAQNINLTTTKLSHPSLQIDIEAAQGFIDSMVHEGGYDDVMPLKVFNKMVKELPNLSERNQMARYAKINWTRVRQVAANVGYAALPVLNTAFPESIPFNPIIGRALKMVGGKDYVPRFACIIVLTSSVWIEDLTMFGCIESNPGPQTWYRYAATVLGCCSPSLSVPTSHQLEQTALMNLSGQTVDRPIKRAKEGHFSIEETVPQQMETPGAMDLIMEDIKDLLLRRQMANEPRIILQAQPRELVQHESFVSDHSDAPIQDLTVEDLVQPGNPQPICIALDQEMEELLSSEDEYSFNDTRSMHSEQINTKSRAIDSCVKKTLTTKKQQVNQDKNLIEIQNEFSDLNPDEIQLLKGALDTAVNLPQEQRASHVQSVLDKMQNILEAEDINTNDQVSLQTEITIPQGIKPTLVEEETKTIQPVQFRPEDKYDQDLFPDRSSCISQTKDEQYSNSQYFNLDNDSCDGSSSYYEDQCFAKAPLRNKKPALHTYKEKFDFLKGVTDKLPSFLAQRNGAEKYQYAMSTMWRPKKLFQGFQEEFAEMTAPVGVQMQRLEDLTEYPNPNKVGYSQRIFATIDESYDDYQEVQVCVTMENVTFQQTGSTILKRVPGKPLVRIQGWTETDESILTAVTTTIYQTLQFAKQFPTDSRSVVTIYFKRPVKQVSTGLDASLLEMKLKGTSWTAAFVCMMFQKSPFIVYAGVIFWTNGFVNAGFYGEYDQSIGYTMNGALAGKLKGWLERSSRDIAFFSVDNNDVDMWNGIFTESADIKNAYCNITKYVRVEGSKKMLLPANLQALDFMPTVSITQENQNLAADYLEGFNSVSGGDKGFEKLLKSLTDNKSMSVVNNMVQYLPVPHFILAGLGEPGDLGYVAGAERRKIKSPVLQQFETVTGLAKVDINNQLFASQCIAVMKGDEISGVTKEQLAFVRLVQFFIKNQQYEKGLASFLGLLYSSTSQPALFVDSLSKMTDSELLAKAVDMQKTITARASNKNEESKKADTKGAKKPPPTKEKPQATRQIQNKEEIIELDERPVETRPTLGQDRTSDFFNQINKPDTIAEFK